MDTLPLFFPQIAQLSLPCVHPRLPPGAEPPVLPRLWEGSSPGEGAAYHKKVLFYCGGGPALE